MFLKMLLKMSGQMRPHCSGASWGQRVKVIRTFLVLSNDMIILHGAFYFLNDFANILLVSPICNTNLKKFIHVIKLI